MNSTIWHKFSENMQVNIYIIYIEYVYYMHCKDGILITQMDWWTDRQREEFVVQEVVVNDSYSLII